MYNIIYITVYFEQ